MQKFLETFKKKKKITIGIIVAIVYLFMLLFSILDNRFQNNNNKKQAALEKESYSEESPVTEESYPERQETKYHSDSTVATESIKENGRYNFTIDNMELIDEESEFPQNQILNMMNAVQEYLNSNSFGEDITVLSVVGETVYYYEDQFGLNLCLNDSMLDYVKVTGTGEDITCTDDNYGEPPELIEEDREEIEKIHKDISYLPDIEYDFYDFPYSIEDMNELIQHYYADMSGNYYENYEKYGADVQKYMEKELEYFNYSYSTYKYNTNLLKKELSNGNEEMYQFGDIKASVKGYMQLYSTNIVAKVELTMSYKGTKEKKTVWATMINDGSKLLILPEDRFVEEYWEYKYQY